MILTGRWTPFVLGTALVASGPARAGWCEPLFGRWWRRPARPAIAEGPGVGRLVNATWTRGASGWLIEKVRTPWGEATLSFNENYLVISLRQIAGDLRLSDQILARLKRDVGPVNRADQPDPMRDAPITSLYLGRAQTGDARYEELAARLLNEFFGRLPYELRQAPPNPTARDLIPTVARDLLPWRAGVRGWEAEAPTRWGQTRFDLDHRRLSVAVEPREGDLIFGARDLARLRAHAPNLAYAIATEYDPLFEVARRNRQGRFELTLDHPGPDGRADVGGLLHAFVVDAPKAAGADILKGHRAARPFDPAAPAIFDEEDDPTGDAGRPR